MSRRGLGIAICGVTVLLAAATPPANGSQKDDPPSTSTPLVEGEGRDIVLKKCTACHDLERVPARRRDRGGWEELVDNMRSRGAEMTAEEQEAIVAYLTAHYGIPD